MGCDESKRLADLGQVLEITRMMGGVVGLDELLEVIIDRSCGLLDAERATLFLYEPQSNELVSRIATGESEIRIPADGGIAGTTIQTLTTVNVPDAYADERFNSDVDRNSGFRTRNILSVPMVDHDNERVGVLQVLNKRSGAFDDHDVDLAETLAAQAGVSCQRARLIEHYVQKQQMAQALQIAREIQRDLLPDQQPDVAGYDIAGYNESADETGGDIYDFRPLPDGRLLMIVADASGHGVGPAMVIAEARAMLRASSVDCCDLPHLLATTNRLLAEDLSGRFVTCFLGLLDPKTHRMEWASAGHAPIVFYDSETDTFSALAATGMPLAILPDSEFDEVQSFEFKRGDFVAITTDGFFEATNATGADFGIDTMLEVFRTHRDRSATDMIAQLHGEVTEFVGDLPQADDLTAVLIKRV
jgi:phosphoserine phosphatase RsbU/P